MDPAQQTYTETVSTSLFTQVYLHAQTEGVQHDEQEHEVLEVTGSHNVPHPILVGVLGDVAT